MQRTVTAMVLSNQTARLKIVLIRVKLTLTALVQVVEAQLKAVPHEPGVEKYFPSLCAMTFSKMRAIISKGILHIFGIGLKRQVNECHCTIAFLSTLL